jgi:hypothetical protein
MEDMLTVKSERGQPLGVADGAIRQGEDKVEQAATYTRHDQDKLFLLFAVVFVGMNCVRSYPQLSARARR